MPAVYPLPEELLTNWAYPRHKAVDFLSSAIQGLYEAPHEAPEDVSKMLGLVGYPESPKEAMGMGAMSLMPGYIAANFRTPEAIQALRKMMAEEMRSRGGLAEPNPIDQILRGSWYHGMSKEARQATGRGAFDRYDFYRALQEGRTGYADVPSSAALPTALETGFPLSHHDALSLSNKPGEPSGVSLTMLPTKAREFSADEYIHRVLPRYGGPPPERTVNLMTLEGRKMLNDAYDVVANRMYPTNELARQVNTFTPQGFNLADQEINNVLGSLFLSKTPTGSFNQALSQQLQSQGMRGLLYNPHRWNEYEMLMLDPKYVLPVDYRRVGEYLPRGFARTGGGSVSATPKQDTTPGMYRGLSQIQDMMQSNASRLGDIYAERPWTQRLSKENKDAILQMIDEKYREIVGRQLYGGG